MASENQSTESREASADGAVDEAKGRVKKAVGALTGDRELEKEGELDRAAGEVKRAAGEAVDAVKDGVSQLLENDDDADEK